MAQATLHVTLGYTMAGLVAFRIVGLASSRPARFGDFVRVPKSVLRQLRSLGWSWSAFT